MTDQKEIFVKSEGDGWFQRNQDKLNLAECPENDKLLKLLFGLKIQFQSILEIGCSNGHRLEALRRKFGAQCHGIDPSSRGIAEGKSHFPELQLQTGTADCLPGAEQSFDLVIFGFCLYLCDRRDLFKIAYEADRVLKEDGFIAVLDFQPPFAYRNEYVHCPGISTYKMDYARLFSWNPAYSIVASSVFSHQGENAPIDPNERVSATILRKNLAAAYPRNPFST